MSANPELEKLNEIAVKVGRMEATQEAQAQAIGRMAGSVERLIDKLDKSDDIAREADLRAKSAHHRIDDMGKQIDNIKRDHVEDIKDIRVGQRWLIGTTISVVAIFLTALGLLWRGIG